MVKSRKVKHQKNKRFKLGLVFLAVVSVLVSVSWLWQRSTLSIWDGRSRISIIEQTKEQIKLVTYQPQQNRMVELVIPGNTMVKVPFGLGEYQLKNIYQLGQLDDRGGELLRRSAQDLIGVSVEGFVKENETNLSWWDKSRLWWEREFKALRLKSFNLNETASLKQDYLKDDSQIYVPSLVLIDELINREYFSDWIVKEDLAVAVVNASQVEGVAKTIARIVANLGGRVVMVANVGPQEASKILVVNKNLKSSSTVDHLLKVFKLLEVEVGEVEEYRAEVVVVIGKDYASGLGM